MLKIFKVAPFLAFSLFAASKADACAVTLPEAMPENRVSITDEAALIVWDKANQTEHFIRRANFQTDAKSRDFGFLVPTPSRPILAPADDALFTSLADQLKPKIETRTRHSRDWTPLVGVVANGKWRGGEDSETTTTMAAEADSDLKIIETRRVGAYDATVLQARDARALMGWMHENKFRTDAETLDWLAPYIENNWTITAFKIAAQSQNASQNAVRLSFKTARPFYPYREPASARKVVKNAPPRSLRVFFVSDARFDGAIETREGKSRWSGNLTYSALLENAAQKAIENAPDFPKTDFKNARLTTFEDFSSPRPGVGEIYFGRDAKQDTKTPAPILKWHETTTWIPLDLVFLAFGGLIWWGWSRKRV